MKEGKTARFELELTHDSVPVVWYRNEVKLHVSRTVLIHVEGKRHTLEMRTLSLDDTCQVKAEAKGSYSVAKLTVIGNAPPSSHMDVFTSPLCFTLPVFVSDWSQELLIQDRVIRCIKCEIKKITRSQTASKEEVKSSAVPSLFLYVSPSVMRKYKYSDSSLSPTVQLCDPPFPA